MFIRKARPGVAAAALAVGLGCGAAPAATFLFDAPGGNSGMTTLSFTEGPLALQVTSSGGTINQGPAGLGVQGAPSGSRMAGDESLTFVFSSSVHLASSVIYETTGGTDDVAVTDAAGTILATFTVGDGTTASSFVTTGLNLIGDTFVFIRTGGTGTSAGLRISSLTGSPIATVPVPAALPLLALLALALGALRYMGRRRKPGRPA